MTMTSDSSASTSPMVLTPESTGTSSSLTPIDTGASTPAKKSRRQTAFYPNVNSTNKPQKPFSRSAAKRESVMALGSIEHLQHYFTKTGIAAKKNPLDKPHHGLVPAIGGRGHVPISPSLSGIEEFQMPPSPAIPSPPRPAFPPHVKTYEVDPESLLPGVIEDVIAVAHAWKLDVNTSASETAVSGPFDVLDVLKTTTRAIRSTRNYLLSLPDESAVTIRAQFRSKNLAHGGPFAPPMMKPSVSSSSTQSIPSTSTSPNTSSFSNPPPQSDPIILIRRSALEVLTVLRHLEETCRLPLSDDAYDAQSDGGHSSHNYSHGLRPQSNTNSRRNSPGNRNLDLPPEDHTASLELQVASSSMGRRASSVGGDPDASISFSLVQVQGRFESVPVWIEDDDEAGAFGIEAEEEKNKRDGWDERLVLGSGWLYKQDVRLEALGKERAVVATYLDVVDEVLFDGAKGNGGGKSSGERGWERVRRQREGRAVSRAAKGRRVSAGPGDGLRGGMLDGPGGPGSDAGRRRVSTGMVNMLGMRGMSLSEEPEDMDGIREVEDEDGEEEEVEDEDLPEWARRSTFVNDRLGRTHALLNSFLPPHLQPYLGPTPPPSNSTPSPSSLPSTPTSPSPSPPSPIRTSFLTSLSSGQLLCIAYNACVRKSKQPWGFVSKNEVHDILALERAAAAAAKEGAGGGGGGKEGAGKEEEDKNKNLKVWTFRRTDNLRLWAGALKLRYTLPIQVPSHSHLLPSSSSLSVAGTPLSSPSATTSKFTFTKEADRRAPPIPFDARVVAKQDEGWEEMLEGVLFRWVDKVLDETRRRFH